MTAVVQRSYRVFFTIWGRFAGHKNLEIPRFLYNSRWICSRISPLSMTHPPIESVLIDLSGTIHIDDAAIPNSLDALKRLRESNLKLKFVTNTTKESLGMLHARLEKLKFDIQQNEIFTSLTAARRCVERKGVRPLMFLSDSAKEDFKGISDDDPNAVLIGLAPDYFCYGAMNQAFRLMLGGAPLIAIHKARYFMKKDGLYLGPGGFVSALEYAADTKAEVVGKPESSFFLEAIRDVGADPATTIMIGDDARDDVGGAMKAGMMGILVQTGKYRPGDEMKIDPGPTAICKDFPAAVDYILSHKK